MHGLVLVALMLPSAEPLPVEAGAVRRDVVFTETRIPKFDDKTAKRFGWKSGPARLDLTKESYVVRVPPNYRPGENFGAMVYISPGEQGEMISRQFSGGDLDSLLEKYKLVYVSANASGNQRPTLERLELALVGTANIQEIYGLDPNRTVVGGFSGGGKMACITARFAPRYYAGVLAIGGCDFHRKVFTEKNKYIPPSMDLTGSLERPVRDRITFAFLSGPKDFNYQPTLLIEKAYRRASFRTVLVIDEDLPGHAIPGPKFVDDAFRAILEPEAADKIGTPEPASPSPGRS